MEFLGIADILLKGGPGLVAIVFMYVVWIKNRPEKDPGPKHDIIWEKMLEMEEAGEETMNMVIKLYDMHDLKDEDGVYVWHLRKSMITEQIEIRKVLQDLHLAIRDIHRTQETQTKVLESLIDKLVKQA